MLATDKVNILLVDDQPAKLLSYEVILGRAGREPDQGDLAARGARHPAQDEDVAVVLIDVKMPQLDGFELAAMIREHPRFQKLAIIFVSAIQVGEIDHLRGYEIGAVDYVSVPVMPEVLRAKVRVFVDLYRKTRQLEVLNSELEARVAARTAELEAQTERLRQSEERRSIALSAGDMGSWEVDLATGHHRVGRRSVSHFRRRPRPFRADRRAHRGDDASRRSREEVRSPTSSPWASRASRSSSGSCGRAARCAGATAPASSRATPPASRCA